MPTVNYQQWKGLPRKHASMVFPANGDIESLLHEGKTIHKRLPSNDLKKNDGAVASKLWPVPKIVYSGCKTFYKAVTCLMRIMFSRPKIY